MNGKTTINATLNPCSAEMDRRTYGIKGFNFSIYGNRLICLTVGRLNLDVYRGSLKTFTAMGGGADGSARYWMLFYPLGKVQWITRKARSAESQQQGPGSEDATETAPAGSEDATGDESCNAKGEHGGPDAS